jgi:hypothetical protein
MPWDADSHTFYIFDERRRIIWHRCSAGGGIFGIIAGNGLQHDGGVFDGPGHRSTVVQRPTEWHHTIAADPSIRGFEPDDTAVGGWPPDRAAGAGTQRAHAESGRDGCPGAAARSAGDVLEVPRITR